MRGNPHAAFDVAGAGNVAWSKWCDTRRRKGEPTGNTNIDLNRRVSPRPYVDIMLLGYGAQQQASMAECRDAKFLQVCVCEIRQDGKGNLVLNEPLNVLIEAELL